MNARLRLASVMIPLGLIIAAVPKNTTKPYKLTANELLNEAVGKTQFISPDAVADMVISADPSLRLIDVRPQDEYEKYHLPGAINIPLNDILGADWIDVLDQDVKMNVFYSNGTYRSNEAWMLTRQLGYKNNYVLMGGMNYWAETIMNPEEPASTSPDEEFAKYDFRKGANQALGGAVTEQNPAETDVMIEKPVIKQRPKKKRVQGGC